MIGKKAFADIVAIGVIKDMVSDELRSDLPIPTPEANDLAILAYVNMKWRLALNQHVPTVKAIVAVSLADNDGTTILEYPSKERVTVQGILYEKNTWVYHRNTIERIFDALDIDRKYIVPVHTVLAWEISPTPEGENRKLFHYCRIARRVGNS